MRWPVGSNEWRNAIAGFLTGYDGAAFLLFLGLVLSWAASAPSQPDPIHGQVFQHNEHGSITYFTAFQPTSCYLLFATSIPLAFVGVGIAPKRNLRASWRRLGFSSRWDEDDPGGWRRIGQIGGSVCAPLIVFGLGLFIIEWLNRIGFAVGF